MCYTFVQVPATTDYGKCHKTITWAAISFALYKPEIQKIMLMKVQESLLLVSQDFLLNPPRRTQPRTQLCKWGFGSNHRKHQGGTRETGRQGNQASCGTPRKTEYDTEDVSREICKLRNRAVQKDSRVSVMWRKKECRWDGESFGLPDVAKKILLKSVGQFGSQNQQSGDHSISGSRPVSGTQLW